MLSEHCNAKGVEGAHLNVGTVWLADLGVNAFLHLLRGFVRKGDRKDVFRLDAVFANQVRDAVGDDSCFSCAGTCNNEEWTIFVCYGFSLFFI